MKITNTFFEQNIAMEVQGHQSALTKLCQCNQLPAKTSYWLSRLLQALKPLGDTYGAERKKLIEKWCDKNKDGTPKQDNGQYSLKDHLVEFDAEFQELLSIESEIDIKPIEVQIDSVPAGVLNSYDYMGLDGIIIFKE